MVRATAISDYQIVFHIEPCKGQSVPIVLWRISLWNEISLDVYKGYPNVYRKKNFTILLDGQEETAVAYVITNERENIAPSEIYLKMLTAAYQHFGFDTNALFNAVKVLGIYSETKLSQSHSRQNKKYPVT